jgi:hypothetical protein
LRTTRLALFAAVSVAAAALTVSPGASGARPPGLDLEPTKGHLLEHTSLLIRFTERLQVSANRYYALARSAGFDYGALWRSKHSAITRALGRAKATWTEGNPYYERVEGIVAGTPALAVYDVILDAGSSAQEDPAAAVPFDLTLPNGRVLRRPGNLYNLTEGMLWGTRPELLAKGARPDVDGDGRIEFGEALPDANAFKAAADAFLPYAGKLDRAAKIWQPTASDAFTAVVVMVPTMNEYFGQWKVSRFVVGDRATGDAFNVVSRLSDIHDILGGLRVIYSGIVLRWRESTPSKRARRSASSTPSGPTSASCGRRNGQAGGSGPRRRTCSDGLHRSGRRRSPAR